jgi:hypothetical protein
VEAMQGNDVKFIRPEVRLCFLHVCLLLKSHASTGPVAGLGSQDGAARVRHQDLHQHLPGARAHRLHAPGPPTRPRRRSLRLHQSTTLEAPKSKRATQDGKSGLTWSLPHSIAASREDLDREGTHQPGGRANRRDLTGEAPCQRVGHICVVYDAVFHPDALRLGTRNEAFKQARPLHGLASFQPKPARSPPPWRVLLLHMRSF